MMLMSKMMVLKMVMLKMMVMMETSSRVAVEGGGDWCSDGSGVKLGIVVISFVNVLIFIGMEMKETGILIDWSDG